MPVDILYGLTEGGTITALLLEAKKMVKNNPLFFFMYNSQI